jgi:16S rRNA (guanine966-N2)-methyltransferase
MRVIGGMFKGHRLDAPPGMTARPTTDRVKESMFNLMGPMWTGKVAIDLFAGSGALGIEALSRGAERAVFVDQSRKSMGTVRQNLIRMNLLPQATLIVSDWCHGFARATADCKEVGWVFVDPPYAKRLWEDVLQTIAASEVIVGHGIICEHPKDTTLPDQVASLLKVKERSYGDITVTVYADERAAKG